MSDIKSTFLNITKNLSKTSGDLVKSTKLNMDLVNAEEELKQAYIEIGRKVHEIYRYGGSLGEFFDDKYQGIVTAQQKVDDIKKQIDAVKGVKPCPKCGKSNPRNAEFCAGCGHRLEDGAVEDTTAETVSTPAPVAETETALKEQALEQSSLYPQTDKKTCTACGGTNEAGSKFCLFCGRVL